MAYDMRVDLQDRLPMVRMFFVSFLVRIYLKMSSFSKYFSLGSLKAC